jgi:hypothetical protein
LLREKRRRGADRRGDTAAAPTKPDGLLYFEDNVKDRELPELSGFLVSQSENELALAMTDRHTLKVTLRLSAPIRREIAPGTRVLFVGIARDVWPEPFRFVFDVDVDHLAFLPPKSQ